MSAPLIIAMPSKGRLQENTEAFFGRAGLQLVKPRGARDYRGAIADLPGVEVAYLSAGEIADALAQGAVHLGITGEDLLRETIADMAKRVVVIEGLGFGFANVVVAVPQAWIDVRTMADDALQWRNPLKEIGADDFSSLLGAFSNLQSQDQSDKQVAAWRNSGVTHVSLNSMGQGLTPVELIATLSKLAAEL